MTEDKIIWLDNGCWIRQSMIDHCDKMKKKFADRLLFTSIDPIANKKCMDRIETNRDNRKWAWVYITNKTRKLLFVDNKTMEAYKVDGYEKTNVIQKYQRFDRWATSFDL